MNRSQLREECMELFSLIRPILKTSEIVLEEYKSILNEYDTFYLYGCGFDAPLVVDSLCEILSGKTVYFIDSNPSKHGKAYKGIVCYGKEKMYGCNPKTSIILISTSQYANEILAYFSCISVGGPSNRQYFAGGNWGTYLGTTIFDKGYVETLVSSYREGHGLQEI